MRVDEQMRAAQSFWDKNHELPVAHRIALLPSRQNECITKFLFECKTAGQIAEELGLSIRTIEIHLRSANLRLGRDRPDTGVKTDSTRRILNDYYLGL